MKYEPVIDKENMFIAFKILGREALAMNHYDLAAASEADYTSEEWRKFLSEPDIIEYIKKEMEIIRTSQVNRIVSESASSRSVGQAQLLSALEKINDKASVKTGPVFIYCYVPLNEEQKNAPNVFEVDKNGKPI